MAAVPMIELVPEDRPDARFGGVGEQRAVIELGRGQVPLDGTQAIHDGVQ